MKTIPSPRHIPGIGTTLSIIAAGGPQKLHAYVDRRHKQLGPIYREKIGPVSGVFIADGNYMRKVFALEGRYPRHIVPESWLLYNQLYNCKRGLLFMDGEEWLDFRKTMNNLMLKVKDDEFYDAASIAADALIQNWNHGRVVQDLDRQLYKWSLEVVAAVLLGPTNYSQCQSLLSPAIDQLAQKTHQIFTETAKLSLLPVKTVASLNLPVWKRFVEAATSGVEQGHKIVDKILELERKKSRSGGLLSDLSDQMNLDDLRRIVVDLILAAGDTTAHTMQWILEILARDPGTQERVHREVRECVDERDVLRCGLLKGCLKEALRLYPVAPFITRFMPEDVLIDDFQIRQNELVLMSLYTSGRNPEYFPSPEDFLPERWLRCNSGYHGVRNPTASLPFAMGSRSCVGRKIAETQILVTLSRILENFELSTEKRNKIEMVLHLISVPAEPVEIIVKRRK